MRRFVACIGVLMFICFGLFTAESFAQEKVVKLAFSSYLPANNALSHVWEEWGKELEKRTGGKIKVSYYPSSTLTPAPQTYDSVMRGIADVGIGAMGYTQGRFAFSEVLDLPLNIKSAVVATKLANAFYAKFKPKEFSDVKVLGFQGTGPFMIHTKKQVKDLEGLAGLKLRYSGGTGVKVLKRLGAVPVVMPMGETYDAARKGVVDGVAMIPDALMSWKLAELLNYTTVSYRTAVTTNGYLVMNKDKWNSLPPDIQKIVERTSEEYSYKWAQVFDDMDRAALKKLKFMTLGAKEEERWYQRIRPLYDEYVTEKSAKGLPASEALKFCQDWVKANQR